MEQTAEQMKTDELYYACIDFLKPQNIIENPITVMKEIYKAKKAGYVTNYKEVSETRKHITFPGEKTKGYDKKNFIDLMDTLRKGKKNLIRLLIEVDRLPSLIESSINSLPEPIMNTYVLWKISVLQKNQ